MLKTVNIKSYKECYISVIVSFSGIANLLKSPFLGVFNCVKNRCFLGLNILIVQEIGVQQVNKRNGSKFYAPRVHSAAQTETRTKSNSTVSPRGEIVLDQMLCLIYADCEDVYLCVCLCT